MEKNKKIISLEIPEELYRAVKRAAFDSDKSVSALVRIMIQSYLEKLKTEQKVKD